MPDVQLKRVAMKRDGMAHSSPRSPLGRMACDVIRLRPPVGMRLWVVLLLVVPFVASLAMVMAGIWAAVVVYVPAAVLNGAYLRTSVDVGDGVVTIRNKWRSFLRELSEIDSVTVVTFRSWFGFMPFVNLLPFPRTELGAAAVATFDGRILRCDAMTGYAGSPSSPFPNTAETKRRELAACIDGQR